MEWIRGILKMKWKWVVLVKVENVVGFTLEVGRGVCMVLIVVLVMMMASTTSRGIKFT